MTRLQKRINIILFYLLLISALGGVVYFTTRPEMTCSDGIRNQGEEQVDCGGPCKPCQNKPQTQPLQINSIERATDGQGKEDILIEIYNPNEEYGAQFFEYKIYDGEGIGNDYNYKGESFILPRETKHIIVNNYISQNKKGKITVGIDNKRIIWQKIIKFKDPNLIIYNDKHTLVTSGNGYAQLSGLVVNKSNVDYQSVKVKGILRNLNGGLVSASYQTINSLPSNGKREFHIIFPTKFLDIVAKKEIEIETNIFDSDNYLKARGQQDTWDQ